MSAVALQGRGSSGWRWVAGCMLLSLALNLVYLAVVQRSVTIEADAIAYDRLGWQLAQGQGFPAEGEHQPELPPLYPLFLGAVYALVGHNPHAVRLIQAVLVACVPLLVFLIASELKADRVIPEGAVRLAPLLAALYPPFVFYSAMLYRETLITFLLAVSMWQLVRSVSGRRLRHLVGFGVAIALTALTDNRFLYLPLCVAVALWLWDRRVRVWVRFGMVSALTAAAVIGPWTIRNYRTFHRFVPIAVSQEKGFWLATHPGEFLEWDWRREPLKSYAALDPATRHQVLSREAWENLERHPFVYMRLCVKRFFRFWLGGHSNMVPRWRHSLTESARRKAYGVVLFKLLCLLINLSYLVGGAIGAVSCLRASRHAAVAGLVAVVGYVTIVHTLVFAAPRYHLPIIPILIVCFAYGLSRRLIGPAKDARPSMRLTLEASPVQACPR